MGHLPGSPACRESPSTYVIHCYTHGEDERLRTGHTGFTRAYLVCDECFHVYGTPGDLEIVHFDEWNRRIERNREYRRQHPDEPSVADEIEPLTKKVPAAEILSCPYCLHLF